MHRIDFSPSKPFTLGVELEFQVLDRTTLNLVPMAPAVMATVPDQYQSRIAPEFLQSIFEIRTGVCSSVEAVEQDLRQTIEVVEACAHEKNCMLFSSSLHPFARPVEQCLSFGERYQRIMRELQFVGRQFICQGLHVHVGMPDRESAITVCDSLQIYLPLLLALSCSSPFYQGEDTGFCSYRTKLFEVLPLAGVVSYHGSWAAFEKNVGMLIDYQIITELRDLWWDIRPSPGFGTVEIRICDLPVKFSHILGLVSLIQAFACFLAEEKVSPAEIRPQILESNKWQAARHGLQGRFVDMLGLCSRQAQPMGGAVDELLVRLDPFFVRFGTRAWLQPVRAILDRGSSADRQRKLVVAGLDFPSMIDRLQKEYWK